MPGKSVFTNVMLVVIALILIVGFYFLIDDVDLCRLRTESLVTQVGSVDSELAHLRESGGLPPPASAAPATSTAPASSPAPASAPAVSEKALPEFDNCDLRDPDAVNGDYLVTGMQTESGNLNYIINNEATVFDFWAMCTDTLAERKYRNPSVYAPKLAERWEVSEDKLTYTIHLRKGVLWQDFTDPTTHKSYRDVEVTADDFKFYMDVIMNPGIPCAPIRSSFDAFKELRVLDRYTFQVIWKRPFWPSESLTLELIPLPRHFYQFDPAKPDDFTDNTERNRMIVGCGPWVFDSWQKGKQISFRRNEAYYAPKPYLLRRIFKIIKEPTARLLALRGGEIDRMVLLPQQWVNQTGDKEFNDKFAKLQWPARAFTYIGYNERRDFFKDARVRLALTHLVDRERILKEVYFGLGRIVTGPFYIESPSYDPSIQPWPFDVQKARELLAEAGWKDTTGNGVLDKDGKKFEFTFMTISGFAISQQIAEIVREDFAKAGIVVDISPIEWSVYTERLDSHDFDVCNLAWSLGWEDDPYQIWHSSQADVPKGSNSVGFKNAEADKIIEEARGEFDVAKRTALYHRLDLILHEQQPYTFLISPDESVALDRRFHNAKVWTPMNDMYPDAFWVPVAQQKYKQ